MSNQASEIATGLVDLWQRTLGVDNVKFSDDFFELGGNSISAIRLIPLINERFGIEPHVALIFEHPTPLELATALVRYKAENVRQK